MKPIDIIAINMSSYREWQDGVSNRNNHVIHELLKDDRVGKILAVDYPPITAKRALRSYKENIVPTLENGIVVRRSLVDKVTKLSDRLFVFSSTEFFIRPHHVVEQIKKAALALGFGDYILWSFYPFIMKDIRGMGQKLTVFDAVDNWAEHPSYAQVRKRLAEDYALIKQTADVIFTTSEELQALFDNQPNVYWVPNGVDIAHYQNQHVLVNRDIADLPKPIIGYIGVVQDRVDIELIKFCAMKNPTKSFVIVGPVWNEADEQSLKQVPNIHALGYKTYQEAPAYIQQFDVAIIPHKKTKFIASTNPMKMYEYLACGKPIVATKDSGAEMFKGLIYIADEPEDFNRKLFLALQEDTKELQEQRKQAVADFSWSAVVKQMMDLVAKKMNY